MQRLFSKSIVGPEPLLRASSLVPSTCCAPLQDHSRVGGPIPFPLSTFRQPCCYFPALQGNSFGRSSLLSASASSERALWNQCAQRSPSFSLWAALISAYQSGLDRSRAKRASTPQTKTAESGRSRAQSSRQGTFRIYEICHQPISRTRLEAVPWTHRYRDCKEQEHA
jgi:RNA polymerase-binding transcription factor DksA